jgi:hypothetical protein
MYPTRRTAGASPRIRDRSGAQLQAETPARPVYWDRALIWFMRALALLWIAKGLAGWALIVGAGHPTPSFEVRSTGFQASVIYFAVIDLIAAVGLWLASTWGGVVWLLTTVSYHILGMLFPALVPLHAVSGFFFVCLMVGYFVFSWLAAREG